MEDTSSGSKIVVAVDFGTAYSSVAWASASNTERHRVINQWPQGPSTSFGGMTSEKVPTEVAYEYGKSGTTCLWGFQIYDCMPHIQWIKLGFAGDRKFGLASRLSFNYHDRRRVPEPYHSSNEDVATDYLRCLYKHIIESLKSKIGSSFDGMSLEFVLNVPAMWPDKAKMTTLRYTEHAGFGENGTIRLISEPEAAAMHALNVANPHGLNVGDTVVLCDVGGGTVDLITFSIAEWVPNLRLKEGPPGMAHSVAVPI